MPCCPVETDNRALEAIRAGGTGHTGGDHAGYDPGAKRVRHLRRKGISDQPFSSDSTFCELWLAWASIAVEAWLRICDLANWVVDAE